LRRRGYYLAHAFAAERDGRAILLAGPSGSGKTTAGLSLISAGWRFLANDVVLLRRLGDTVFALPTPGGIGLTAQTIRMIPSLAAQLRELRLDRFKGKEYLPADEVVSGWGQAAAVATVLFPEITKRDRIQTVPCGKAVTLARLMESSLDRWDEFSLPGHIDLLQILSGQATGYRVYLGRGMSYFPESLAAIW
jgi:hypothetical protein